MPYVRNTGLHLHRDLYSYVTGRSYNRPEEPIQDEESHSQEMIDQSEDRYLEENYNRGEEE